MSKAGLDRLPFRRIWAADFEFGAQAGERPDPVCLVARELRSGQVIRWWQDDLRRHQTPPYGTGAVDLFVSYFASAELGCHLALGWPMPTRVLDLFVEYRAMTNGLPTPGGRGLLGALGAHGLAHIDAAEKAEMRDLVLRGGPWSAVEREAILDYCQSDVDALAELLPAMLDRIDIPRALLRGRYVRAVAAMEHAGVPIDAVALDRLRAAWDGIKAELVRRVDINFGVFEGITFKTDRFTTYLDRAGIAWPRLESGALALDNTTFKERCQAHPELEPLRQLRKTLAELRLQDLAVGRDGRNRTLISPFGARSGRNTPSNAKFIFGPAAWLRSLIRPPPGHGLAYIDWSAQEIGIAAALSGDSGMIEGYRSGDPYLAFAKAAGAAPEIATKQTHKAVRDRYKAVVLGTNYGMQEHTLARRIGCLPFEARELLRQHRKTYPRFWRWSDGAVDHAMMHGSLHTVFGWPIHVPPGANPRSLMNFPMQANGAEILRLACCLGTEAGIEVCAPVHDAVLITASLGELDGQVAAMREIMAEAGRIVLDGFELRTDAYLIRYPGRFVDPRGASMWATVMDLLAELEGRAA